MYLADKDLRIFGYSLSLNVVEYQTAVLRGDMDAAAEILPTLPKEQLNKVARFLEGRGAHIISFILLMGLTVPLIDLKELALSVTTDPDHKFDLALGLDDLDTAVEIARSVPDNEADVKWKALGDRALAVWRFDLARESFEKAGDLSALMLLLLATGERAGLKALAEKASEYPPYVYYYFAVLFGLRFLLTDADVDSWTVEKGQNNLAFAITLQLGDPAACVALLQQTQRAPEAALFARTYAPRCVFSLISFNLNLT